MDRTMRTGFDCLYIVINIFGKYLDRFNIPINMV